MNRNSVILLYKSSLIHKKPIRRERERERDHEHDLNLCNLIWVLGTFKPLFCLYEQQVMTSKPLFSLIETEKAWIKSCTDYHIQYLQTQEAKATGAPITINIAVR